MTYIIIDTRKKEALTFLEYVKTLPFATVYQKPNADTLKAMNDVRKKRTRKHKDAKSLVLYLNK